MTSFVKKWHTTVNVCEETFNVNSKIAQITQTIWNLIVRKLIRQEMANFGNYPGDFRLLSGDQEKRFKIWSLLDYLGELTALCSRFWELHSNYKKQKALRKQCNAYNYSHVGIVRIDRYAHKNEVPLNSYSDIDFIQQIWKFVLLLPRPWVATMECKESALACVCLLQNRPKKSKLQEVIYMHFPSPPAY